MHPKRTVVHAMSLSDRNASNGGLVVVAQSPFNRF